MEERNQRAPREETPLMAYRRGGDVTPSRRVLSRDSWSSVRQLRHQAAEVVEEAPALLQAH